MEKCLNLNLDISQKKKSMLQEYEVLKIRKWQLQFTLKNMKYILCIENVG